MPKLDTGLNSQYEKLLKPSPPLPQVEKHGSREVRIEGAEVIGTCCWMFGYEGSQRVLRIFDDADDNQLVEEVCTINSVRQLWIDH